MAFARRRAAISSSSIRSSSKASQRQTSRPPLSRPRQRRRRTAPIWFFQLGPTRSCRTVCSGSGFSSQWASARCISKTLAAGERYITSAMRSLSFQRTPWFGPTTRPISPLRCSSLQFYNQTTQAAASWTGTLGNAVTAGASTVGSLVSGSHINTNTGSIFMGNNNGLTLGLNGPIKYIACGNTVPSNLAGLI